MRAMTTLAKVVKGGAQALLESDAPVIAIDGDSELGAIVLTQDGHVVREVAAAGSAKAALYAIAASRKRDPVFPDAVLAEVARWQEHPEIDDPLLDDLTELAFVTIDGRTSRDLDQALHIVADGEGHVVRYALADASHYVRPGTALFDEALRRGASFYLPGVMIPMLPTELSEGIVSLNPDVDRRAMLLTMRLDADGRCTETHISRARIRSRAKLDWGGVEAFYEGGDGFGEEVDRCLSELAIVGARRMRLADERGVVRYRRSELAVELGGQGLTFVITKGVRRQVERYNEQISLLCNVEGAKVLAAADDDHVEPIYRVHPPPSQGRLQSFEEMLRGLVRARELDPVVWLWTRSSERTLAEYLDGLPLEGAEGRLAKAVHRQAVMVNVRSTFQTDAAGHHGVGADVYARFSAPMREIVGVFLHLETWESLAGAGNKNDALREQIVVKANEVKMVQKRITDEANRLVIDQLCAGGDSFFGTVMGLSRGKIHVMLDAPSIDVKIYLKHQERIEGEDVSLEGTCARVGARVLCRLGDRVRVRVHGRDDRKDRWRLTVETP